jgi:hypothetical protein
MLNKIRQIVRLMRLNTPDKPAAKPQVEVTPIMPQAPREYSGMRPTGTTFKLGNDEYPVYVEICSRQPQALVSPSLFVPLHIFKGKTR